MINSIYSPQKLKTLARKLDRSSNFTPYHSERVANYALELCKALGIRGKKKDLIVNACLVHDVGKAVVDKEVWSKTDKLNLSDWHLIRMYPKISAILAKESGLAANISEFIYYQHIWYNGNGYPEADKKGQRIPIGARILAICDAFEAMVSGRPYRVPISREEAIEQLRKRAIDQFDPRLVEVFIEKVINTNA